MYQEPLTIDELAKKLKVPKSWIYGQTRQTGAGTIPRLRVGKISCGLISGRYGLWLEINGTII